MSSRVLLGVAATAVSALLIGLWLMVKPASGESARGTTAPLVSSQKETREETPAPSTPAPTTSARKATVPTMAKDRKLAPPPATDIWTATPSAPPPAPDPAQAKTVEIRNLLRTQVIATEQAMIECLEKGGKGVKLLDGEVAFPLVVSRKDGKIVTESNTVDYTTIRNPAVVDCMAGVMKKMAYEELTDGVASVTSYRKITVKDGVIVEDWLGPHETVDTNAKPPTR